MKKLRPNAVRLGALLFAGVVPPLHAQDARLEEIVVTAPMHKGEAETVHPLNVIAGAELRRKLAATIGDTLKEEQGVSFASFGPGVGQPVIRGQGAPRVLVLQNSMPVADASNTSGDHANATEPVLAERIEVLRGPATLLYGSGAIGGVVNVIDNRVPGTLPARTAGALEYRRGSNANADVAAGRLDGAIDAVALHLDGFVRENAEVRVPGNAALDGGASEGRIGNSDAEASSATAGASWVFDRGFAGLAVNRLENEYGIPPGAHDGAHHADEAGHGGSPGEDTAETEHGDEDVRIDLEQTRYDARSELRDPIRGVELLRAYAAWTDYRHDELEGGAVGTRYGAEAWDGRLEAVHRLGERLHGALGMQVHQRDFTARGEEAFVPDSESASWGVFLVEDLHVGDVAWEFGARYNRDEHDPAGAAARDFDTFSLSASALWSLGDEQTLKLALSGAERAPTVEELYSNGVHVATRSYERGDATLDPERSVDLDLGYHLHADALDLTLEAFWNRYADYIYQADSGEFFDPALGTVGAVCSADDADECLPLLQWSAADADFRGIEAELRFALARGVELGVFGDVVHGEFQGGGAVPRVPAGRLGAELVWEAAGWALSARLTRVFEQDRTGGGEAVAGYTLLGAHAEYGFAWAGTQCTLFLRGENLLDEEVRNAASLLRDVAPEPGLNVEAGVRLSF